MPVKSLTNKVWRVLPKVPPAFVHRFPQLPPLLLQLLYNRGITHPNDVLGFLRRELTFDNPFRLRDMNLAVDRVRRAIRRGENIVVYGDFDADGVTSSVLMAGVLKRLGARVRVYIPHRIDEGYGLNVKAMRKLAAAGTHLLLTVDCGIRSVEEVAYARSLGMDVIVTDHHSVGERLPPALAVINPKREDDPYPFKGLAGVGVAYKLAQALTRVERQLPLRRGPGIEDLEEYLDLVALGTVADIVPLVGENRTLVHRGLERLNRPARPGILALMEAAGIRPGNVDTMAIGFMLAPRINAAGRLASAGLAFKLLSARDLGEALPLASQLNTLNRQRQYLTQQAVERARAQIAAQEDNPIYIVEDEDFLPGIVGLIAGQITTATYRPTLAIHLEEEMSRGSARSIPEFHITRALDRVSHHLVRYGGHAAAAGFTVTNDRLPAFKEELVQVAREVLGEELPEPVVTVDAELDLDRVDWTTYEHIQRLAPFGEANPQPVFLSRNVLVQEGRAVGSEGKHLKLTLAQGRRVWPGIAFKLGHLASRLPSRVDVIYHLGVNDWNGQRALQLVVLDIREAQGDGGNVE